MRKYLTPRQVRFCEEYVIDFNATKAARRAGYSPNGIEQAGVFLTSHEGVRFLIDHLQRSKEARIVSVDPDYVIQKTVSGIDKADKLNNLTAYFRGLELIARHLGMLRDKTEISGPDGAAIRVQQEQDAISIQELIRHLSQKQTFVIEDSHHGKEFHKESN